MGDSEENLVFIFTLTNQFEGLDEPVLLITKTPLKITQNIGQTLKNIDPELSIEKAIQLRTQEPIKIVDSEQVISTGFTLIYSENNENRGLLTTGNIKIADQKLTITSDLEVVDISELMKKGILEALPNNFLFNMNKLKEQLIALKNNKNVSKGDFANAIDNNENVNHVFKQVITEFISLTEKILNISNFKKFISFNENNYGEVMDKLKDDSSKVGNIQTLLKYYKEKQPEIESVWKQVDFSEFKNYEGASLQEKGVAIQTVYQDLVYTDNEILHKSKKNDDDKDDFFKSNNYKGIDNDYQVILKRFTEYLYRFKNKDNMFSGNNNQQYETMNFLYTVINNHYQKLEKFVTGDILTKINGGDDDNKNNFPQAINTMIRNIMKTNILTFVKIRNDQHNDKSYNKRMDIQVNEGGNPKHLLLQYNDDNMQYYKEVEDKIIKSNITDYGDKFEQDGLDFNVKKYDKQYLFGEFTQVFTPDLNNGQIAEKMTIVKDNLLSSTPKPVFLMGYGASGAGKTSTLIYFNQEKTDGILINLCNQVGSEYKNMEVQYREFYDSDMCSLNKTCKDDDSGKGKTFTETPVGITETTANFEFDDRQYTLSQKFDHKHHHEFRIKKLHEKDNTNENIDKKITTFNEGTTLGELMIYLIDTDRHVKATTNNPNSSRSHSLIFVKFTNKEKAKTAHLIVGDFAGVENEFDCDNPKVKEDFMNIKADKKDKDGKEYAFYKEEYDNNILDPIGPKEINKTGGQKGGDEESDKNDDKLPMITPDNLEINFKINKTKWIEDGGYSILKEFNEKGFSLFAKLFIKPNGKEYDKLNDTEYTNLLNSFYNYRVAIQTSYSKKTDESDVIGYDTDEIKNFKSAFKSYKNYSDNAKSSKAKENDYKKFETAIGTTSVGLIKNLNDQTATQQFDTFANYKPYFTVLEPIIKEMKGYDKNGLRKKLFTYAKNVRIVPDGANEWNSILSDTKRTYNPMKVSLKRNTDIITNKEAFLMATIGPPPGGAGEDPAENVKITHNAIKESAKLLLTKLGITEDYDRYLQIIENVKDGKITYITETPTTNIINKLKADYVNGNFVNFMYSNVFSEKDSELKKFVDNAIDSRNRRLEIGNIVCAHRRTEGYFINDSLKQIRGVIRDLLYEKNKDALGVVPNYIDICFDKYCPTHENCFAFDNKISTPTNDKIDSVIFQQIYTYLKGDNTNYSISQMYKDILVGVFCVINISKKANNPPPVPYVDINDLKRLVYFHSAEDILGTHTNEGFAKGNKTDEFLKLATQLISVIETKYIDTIDGQEKNKIKDIQEALSKITDEYAFHQQIEYTNKADLKYSFTQFKMVVYHLLQNFKTMSGGAPEIDIQRLFFLDLLRLFILKDWAKVEKTDKLNPNKYAKVTFPKDIRKPVFVQSINKYIDKEHPYFIDSYNSLFNPNKMTQINKIKDEVRRKKLLERFALFENDYDVIADNIRSEINKHEEYKLATNHKIRIYIDPDNNERKMIDETDMTTNAMINLAIDEIKSVIQGKVNISYDTPTNLNNFDDKESKSNNLKKKKEEIQTEIGKTDIKKENKDIISDIKSNKPEDGKKIGKLRIDPNFMAKLSSDLEKGRRTISDAEFKDKQLREAKSKLVEEELIRKLNDVNDDLTLEKLSTMSDDDVSSLTESRGSDLTEYINEDNKLIENANRLIDEINKMFNEEQKNNPLEDTSSTDPSINGFEMEGFGEVNNNLIEMIKKSTSVMEHVKEFLEIVENSNAISMVGTLEFTDKMAKLNTVATICNEGGEDLFNNFKQNFKTKPLYGQGTTGGSLKKRKNKTSKAGSRKIKKA